MSTEDEKIPGNMGLKDMLAAVEWIKNEISNFGGNPNQITAFGLSAGAASAHYLCALPRSRGNTQSMIYLFFSLQALDIIFFQVFST